MIIGTNNSYSQITVVGHATCEIIAPPIKASDTTASMSKYLIDKQKMEMVTPKKKKKTGVIINYN